MSEEQAKITVHWLNGSRAQGILFLLEQLNVPYEIKVYHRDPNNKAPRELANVHPLGKSPVVTVTPPGGGENIVLAETPFIVQYINDHFSNAFSSLEPKRWKEGQEGKVGGETEEWLKYQYIMYYAEGSFMAQMVLYFLMDIIRGPKIPFFIRPMTRMVSNMVISAVPFPNLQKHFKMLEGYLEKNSYLCGDRLTNADIVMAFGMVSVKSVDMSQVGTWEKGSFAETYPNVWAYVGRIEQEPAWQKSVEKIKALEGDYEVLPK